MWNCLSCRETVDDEFDACWQCGVERGETVSSQNNVSAGEPLLSSGQRQSQVLTEISSAPSETDIVRALSRRYKDAYTSARWLIRIGGLIKLLAIILAVVIIIFSMILSAAFPLALGGGFAFAFLICIPTYVMGVLTSGQGQTNLASLDTAVNTSRHLTKEDVAALLFG